MSYSPVATIDGIEFHPQASNVGIVTERNQFLKTTNTHNPQLSGTIWRRTPRRQEYMDVFNNVSGIRDLLDDLHDNIIYATTTNTSYGDVEYSYTSHAHGGKSVDIDRTPLSEFFDRANFLKHDIEFAVEQLNMRGHGEVVIHFFHEYPNEERQHIGNFTHYFHTDITESYYIQVGGAGFEFTNKLSQENLIPVLRTNENDMPLTYIANIMDEMRASKEPIGTLEPADFMQFNGWASGQALVHRAPHIDAVKREGRLAISIYPS